MVGGNLGKWTAKGKNGRNQTNAGKRSLKMTMEAQIETDCSKR